MTDATSGASPEGETHPDATPIDAADTSALKDELNRRSAEGQNVTSDGSVLQEASAAEIEAEIRHRGEESDEEPADEASDDPADDDDDK